MIKFNNQIIKQVNFGDGTLKIENIYKDIDCTNQAINKITWLYDNDSELFTLQCLVDHIRECRPRNVIYLEMPYIPNARQDRKVSNRLFTLKTFAKIINAMNFDKVIVLDPHSDVSCALLDKLEVIDVNQFTDNIDVSYDTIMFPDLGASKKYGSMINAVKDHNVVVGNKVRDWNTGAIKCLDILGDQAHIKNKNILIIDDVCSFGSTYFFAGEKLKELGAKNIYLYVSHCENSIHKGNLLQEGSPITKIITTDSILTQESDKISIIKNFR